MKKILLASAAITAIAPAAFADVDADLAAALNAIEDAYTAMEGDASQSTVDELTDLVYYADNHGAVSNIDFGTLTKDADGNFEIGDLVVEYHDFADEISSTRTDLVDAIAADFYGASDKGHADISVAASGGEWSLSGLTSGLVHDFLEKDEGFVAALNDLQNDLDVTEFNADAIAEINDEVETVQEAADEFNAAVDAVNTAQGDAFIDSTETDLTDYTYAVRSGATVDLIDADGDVTEVVAEVQPLSAIETFLSYTDLVTNYVDVAD